MLPLGVETNIKCHKSNQTHNAAALRFDIRPPSGWRVLFRGDHENDVDVEVQDGNDTGVALHNTYGNRPGGGRRVVPVQYEFDNDFGDLHRQQPKECDLIHILGGKSYRCVKKKSSIYSTNIKVCKEYHFHSELQNKVWIL